MKLSSRRYARADALWTSGISDVGYWACTTRPVIARWIIMMLQMFFNVLNCYITLINGFATVIAKYTFHLCIWQTSLSKVTNRTVHLR